MTGGMDFRYVMVPLPVGTSVASGIIARCPRFGTHAHEAAANADLMAAAPDLAALVADLWAEVERLTNRRVVTVCAEHGDELFATWEDDDGELLVMVKPCPLCARDSFEAGRLAAGRNQ